MEDSPTTPKRTIKIEDRDWREFDHASIDVGGKGSVIRRLVRLWLTDPVVQRKVARLPDPVRSRNPSVGKEA